MFGANKVAHLGTSRRHPGYNDLGAISGAVGVASGISSLLGGSSSPSGSAMGGTIYDPFGSHRAASGNALMNLMMGLPIWGGSTGTSTGATTGSAGGMSSVGGGMGAFGTPLATGSTYVNPLTGGITYGTAGLAGRSGGDNPFWRQLAGTGGSGSGNSTGGTSGSGSGIGTFDPNNPYGFLTSDPSYMWRYLTGLDAMNRTIAAQGTGLGGGALNSLMSYGQGMASQEFGNEFSRLAAMAGVGSWSGSNYGSMQAAQQQAGWGAIGQGLGALSQGNFGLWGSNPTGGISYGGGGSVWDYGGLTAPVDYGGGTATTYGTGYTPAYWE